MGARLLVAEDLEDAFAEVWLILLLFELIVEDVRTFDEVLLVLLLFWLVCNDVLTEVLMVLLLFEIACEDVESFVEDFAEVLVLVFLLVDETLADDFKEVLAAS